MINYIIVIIIRLLIIDYVVYLFEVIYLVDWNKISNVNCILKVCLKYERCNYILFFCLIVVYLLYCVYGLNWKMFNLIFDISF